MTSESSQASRFSYSRRNFLKTSLLAAGGTLAFGCVNQGGKELIEILHLPSQFSKRAGDLTANIVGQYNRDIEQIRYQVNCNPWTTFLPKVSRVPEPFFTLEVNAADLQTGNNSLTIETTPKRGEAATQSLPFEYQPAAIALPTRTDWQNSNSTQLDVQDGYWETFQHNDEWRVRPTLGYEDYDRILNVTGAFAGGRRVETDLTFRSHIEGERYGFGLLPMWGGHPDEAGVSPRRGWTFGIAWFYSTYNGIGAEFSYKVGKEDANWISSFRNFQCDRNVKYKVIAECFPVVDAAGKHLHYTQRVKWFAAKDSEPEGWLEVIDKEGAPLPEEEYAVALVAHRSQVEFGEVTVSAIETLQANKT